MNIPQPVVTIVAVLAALALGSLPTGYLVGRRLSGVDLRRLSPHNLGVGAVVSAAGVITLATVAALDVIKGAAALVLAGWLGGSDWTLAAAAAAVVAGHTYSPFWLLLPRAAARVKSVAVATGVVVTLAILGAIPWIAVAVPAVVVGVTLGTPRLAGLRWGYLSLATVLAALSLPVALWILGRRFPFFLASLAYGIVTLWSHKEHLARIVDDVEPRLGERLPLPWLDGEEAVCAFLIHPMTVDYVWQTNRFRWLAPLHRRGLVSDRVVRWLARFIRPMKVADLHPIVTADGRRARVYLIGTPLMPDQIRDEPALAVRRAVQAAHLAANLGATVMGLGAYWSVVGNKGLDVQARSPIAITNGGAYTAGTVKMAVPVVLDRLRARGIDPSSVTAAVVGANGVVGFGICRGIAEHVGRLIMVGTDQARLERSKELLLRRYPTAVIEATTRYDVLPQANVVFTATSSPSPVIFPEHLKPGCLVIDLGRPPDVDPSVSAMPGVEIIPGGVVRLPGEPDVPAYFDYSQYGRDFAPACLAETIILGHDGCFDRASLGERTKAENVDYFVTRGEALGFEVLTAGNESQLHPGGRASQAALT